MGDIDYIVGLYDEFVGSKASREHTFPWLRDEEGALAPVTAYYEEQGLAVIVLDEPGDHQHEPWLRDRLAVLDARDLRVVLLTTDMFARDASGALQRGRGDDLLVVTSATPVPSAAVGWTTYGPLDGGVWHDWLDDEVSDREEVPDSEHEDADPEPLVGGVPELSWRSRPIAQAVLGAATLGRRAFEPRHAGERTAVELQVLTTLLLLAEDDLRGERAYETGNIAATLAADRDDIWQSVHRLETERLIERPLHVYDMDDPIAITSAGADAVREWLARVALLFPGWPPEHPEADDATGPEPSR